MKITNSVSNTSIAKLAAENPTTLACMHGASWSGKGSELLAQLASSLR